MPNSETPTPQPQPPDDARRLAWERATNVPLTALAVLFLAVYAWRVLDTSPHLDIWLTRIDLAIWILFAADFAIRFSLSTDRLRFVRQNPIDLLVVLLPPARPLRLLRAVLLVLGAVDRRTRTHTRMRLSLFVAASSVLVLLLCSLALYDVERGAEAATVTSFADALWWSAVTVTTVGYGDYYPVTGEGRLVALVLMTFGIGVVSFAIGTTTSWIADKLKAVEATGEQSEREIGVLVDEIRSLRAELAQMRAEIRRDEPTGPAPT
ncbi:potassium channel family protein [Nocardia transvalensis]|uniref:potassium channel family protein n=1 Tax=Nocardia transvalensis TaxID=37333 RepID=UPI0018960AA8|nr:potassium channel family protein [Nocardia transvalensis]MBF6331265.1 two pore domain potassium channel family protein [Nocardia transvalensis]